MLSSKNYYAIFFVEQFIREINKRETEKERKQGKSNKRREKKEKRGRKQEITGCRRVSVPPSQKNGIFISILSDTGKNEASTELGKLEKNRGTSRSFLIGGFFCAQTNIEEREMMLLL